MQGGVARKTGLKVRPGPLPPSHDRGTVLRVKTKHGFDEAAIGIRVEIIKNDLKIDRKSINALHNLIIV